MLQILLNCLYSLYTYLFLTRCSISNKILKNLNFKSFIDV